MEPGKNTSEFSLTKLIVIAGFVVTLIGALLQGLQETGVLEGVAWVPTVVMAIGMATALLKGLGYTAGRTTLKAAELTQKGTVAAASLIPLVKEAVALAKEAAALPVPAPLETAPSPAVAPTP